MEGGRYQGTTGDNVVLKGACTFLHDIQINKAPGNGVTIGKAGTGAVAVKLTNVQLRENAGYGIQTVAASDFADGRWTSLDIGNSRLSEIKLDTGAQNLTNVHVWGSGLESATDNHGIWINSTGNLLVTWQSEKNLGSGVYVTGSNNELSCGRAWGNTISGIRALNALRCTLVGNQIYWNGVANVGGTTARSFSGIYLDGTSQEWTITGNNIWDSAVVVPPGSYVTAPTYPYMGRDTAVLTQPYGYAEAGFATSMS